MMAVDATTALGYLDAGIAVVPPREDGTKRPDGTWRQYEHEPPHRDTVARWYANPRDGIGAVCGASSGHLEMLELEGRAVDAGLWERLKTAIDNDGLGGVLARITEGYMERSPSGGIHLLFRVPEGAKGNQKLARTIDPDTASIEVLIETRGQGGFTILAPSGGKVHDTGKGWTVERGSIATLATLTAVERDALYAVCASFDELNRPTVPEPDEEAHWEDVSAPTVAESWFDAVVSDYNGSTTWAAKLHGWTEHHRHGNVTYWTRPGKDPRLGHSATTNAKGTDRLIAFSSAVHHLVEPWDGTGRATSYDRFSWYAIHEHNGDRLVAARQLRSEGYGPRPSAVVDTTYVPVDEEEPWGDPQPLPEPDPVPAWPTDVFPAWMEAQVANAARSIQCPPDIPASYVLGALAVAALGKVEVEARPGHMESTAVYLSAVAGVSEGKTPASEIAMAPIEAVEDQARKQAADAESNANFEREMIEEQIAGHKKAAALGDEASRAKAEALLSKLNDLEVPPSGRMMTSDITPERLATLMAASGDRLSVVSDEGGPLNIDRYGDKARGSNMDLYLKAWSGKRHTQDRQKAPSVLLRRPLLNFVLGAQPEAWDTAMADVEFRTRGLGARFMTCRPARMAHMRDDNLDRDVWDQDADDAYNVRMGDLARRFQTWQVPAKVTLSHEARSAWSAWAKRVTNRTRPGGDLDHDLGWVSKLKTTVIRVSALLHLAESYPHTEPVSAEIMDRACRLGDYWIGHRLHEPGTGHDDARRLLGALVARGGRATGPFVARRELGRSGPRGLRKIEEFTPALTLLIELGLVRLVGVTGGPNMQVSAAIREAAGMVPHPRAEEVLGRATPRDTRDSGHVEGNESERGGESVARVARVAIRESPDTPPEPGSDAQSPALRDTRDTRDTIGVSCDLVQEDDDPLAAFLPGDKS